MRFCGIVMKSRIRLLGRIGSRHVLAPCALYPTLSLFAQPKLLLANVRSCCLCVIASKSRWVGRVETKNSPLFPNKEL